MHGTVDSLILFQTAGTNYILNFNSSFAAATADMTDSSWYKYDLRRGLNHVNMTECDSTK